MTFERVTVTLPGRLLARLDRVCRDDKITRSELVRQLIDDHLGDRHAQIGQLGRTVDAADHTRRRA